MATLKKYLPLLLLIFAIGLVSYLGYMWYQKKTKEGKIKTAINNNPSMKQSVLDEANRTNQTYENVLNKKVAAIAKNVSV